MVYSKADNLASVRVAESIRPVERRGIDCTKSQGGYASFLALSIDKRSCSILVCPCPIKILLLTISESALFSLALSVSPHLFGRDQPPGLGPAEPRCTGASRVIFLSPFVAGFAEQNAPFKAYLPVKGRFKVKIDSFAAITSFTAAGR